jgi:uncharacterized protein YfcZ (UPF0381/DUF406 family)
MQNVKNFNQLPDLTRAILMSFNNKTDIEKETLRIINDLKVIGYKTTCTVDGKISSVDDLDTIELNQTYVIENNGKNEKVFFVNDKVNESQEKYYLIDKKSHRVQFDFDCEISALIFILNNRFK